MTSQFSRRGLIGAGLILPLLTLPGCTTALGGFSFEKAVRRLLTLSAQRAFARLMRDDGFFADRVAQVTLPAELGGTGATSILAALLQTPAVQEKLLRQVNQAAGVAARAATPIILDTIRDIPIPDAVAIVRGDSDAATAFLERSLGDSIYEALLPGVGIGLRLADSAVVTDALKAATGLDHAGLQRDVARKASAGIFRAIAREEIAIRADPDAEDKLIRGVFGILR